MAAAIAVVVVGGAWYTGKRLPAELDHALAQGNAQLQKSLANTGGSVRIERVSLEQHWFSSTARYRLIARDVRVSNKTLTNFEVSLTDHIEHGPFPWSRVKTLRLMPVLAHSTSTLDKDEGTSAWYDAADGRVPVSAQTSLGYGGSIDSEIHLAPVKVEDSDRAGLTFSGLDLQVSGDRDGKDSRFHGSADQFLVKMVYEDQPPVIFELKGLKLGGKLAATAFDNFYAGNVDLYLAEAKMTVGPRQQMLVIKGLEQNILQGVEGPETVGGRVEYKLGDITWDGRAVGKAQMTVSLKSINAPAFQALSNWYGSHLPEFEAAAAAGQPVPRIDMDEAEKAKFQGDLRALLAAEPKLAIEDLSFKTANGESHFNLAADFKAPASFDLPEDQVVRQLVSQVVGKLSLSKPMLGDLATLQALLDGQTDAQAIAMQSSQAGEMVGLVAVQSGLGTVQGSDVVSTVRYADGMVEFNGQKMTPQAFAALLQAPLAGLSPQP